MVIVADTGHEHSTCPTKPWQDILDAEWVELFKSVVYLHVSPYMYLVPGQVDILENVHAWRSMFLSTMITCHSSWAKFMHTLLIFCTLIGTSLQNEWHILEVRQRELQGQIRDSWELQDWLFDWFFSSCTYIHDSVPNLEVIHIRCLEDWRNSWLLEWVYRHVLAKLPVT